MPRFPRFLNGLRATASSPSTMVRPRPWPLRHWVTSTIVVVLLVAALVVTAWVVLRPPAQCGKGLVAAGSPAMCVGLDLQSAGFGNGDALSDLRRKLATLNAAAGGDSATIVVLDNTMPDPASSRP